MLGNGEGGETGVDDEFAAAGIDEPRRLDPRPQHVRPGARTVAGRQLEGLVGRPNPPYHVPVFVLTHHPRAPLEMEGGTTFHFVTDGIESALAQAKAAAAGKDVRLGGGVATVRESLRAGLVDEIHIAISPLMLGSGEALLAGIDLLALGFERTRHATTPNAMHMVMTKRAAAPA